MGRLTELETLVAVVDRGGFAAAARALRRSPSTVTRLVFQLEDRLGVRLLDRSSRRCVPTEAGQRLAADARTLLKDYAEAASAARGDTTEPQGMIRATAPLVFGRQHVAPLVGTFLDAHPGIDVTLHLSDRIEDLHDPGIDLAIRIGPPIGADLVGRSVGEVHRVMVASPAYLERRGTPARPEDIVGHDVIQHGDDPGQSWTFRTADGGERSFGVRARLTVNEANAALDAARAGRGLVRLLSYQAADDLGAGRLVRLLADHEPSPLPVRLAWAEGRQRLRRNRLFIDHLAPALAARLASHLRDIAA